MKQLPAIVYLHGLGASPQSKKGKLVCDRFVPKGYEVRIPDLNVPSIPELSVMEAMRQVEHELHQLGQRPVFVVGSSFGGFLALHSIKRMDPERVRNIRGIVLLGPVVDPWDPTSGLLTPEVERQWCRQGQYPIVSDDGRAVSVHYRFVEELREVASSELTLGLPMLIIHGTRDVVVPHSQSVRFSREHAGVQLVLLDEEHQLLEQPTRFLDALEGFLVER